MTVLKSKGSSTHHGGGRRIVLKLAAGSLAASVPALRAFAVPEDLSSYPDKTIKIVVPYPPGGFNDTLARLVSTHLQRSWKQPVVVENRAGGSTTIGTRLVATAPADGYTLLVAAFPFAINPLVYPNLPYDQKAFAPVVLAGHSPLVLAVPAMSPLQSLSDAVKIAKAHPGTLTYGTAGIAASNHLAMELLCDMAGIRMNHVPYKGGAPAMADLAGGQLDLSFDLLPNALPFLQAGKLRALAVTDLNRSPAFPDVPTVAESIGAHFQVVSWHGLVVPQATPPQIVARLNQELNAMLKLDEVKLAFDRQGAVPVGGSPEEFAAFIDRQTALYRPLVQKYDIRVE
jgi:tripartite-type tricarboxylate transporter receptor subunit TctC